MEIKKKFTREEKIAYFEGRLEELFIDFGYISAKAKTISDKIEITKRKIEKLRKGEEEA